MSDVAIIGAGMVGAATAFACLERGLSVTLIDPLVPRDAASFGNAGVISRGSIFPIASPGLRKSMLRYALNRDPGFRMDYTALPFITPWLRGVWNAATEENWRKAAAALDPLTRAAYDEHWRVAGLIGARDLIIRRGWLKLYRSEAAFAGSALERDILQDHQVQTQVLDTDELQAFEPGLAMPFAKALFFPETGSVLDPGSLVAEWVKAVRARGARIIQKEALSVRETPEKVLVRVEGQEIAAGQLVLATGANDMLLRKLGYHFPLACERGYHRHFARPEVAVSRPVYDTGGGYVISPMNKGLRLLTGIELARRTAAPHLRQIETVESDARQKIGLGERLEAAPWLGSRPSTPDGLPIIGPAPKHQRIVLAIGHGHIGLANGPMTGQIVADLLIGRAPTIPIAAFSAGRFA